MIIYFFIFCLFSGHARADSLKIGIFDLQRIMKESKTAMRHRQEFLFSIEQKRKPLLEREDAVKKMEDKLKKDAAGMTQEERRLIEEKIATEIKELRRQKEDIDSELKKIDQDLTQKTLKEMGRVIQDIAKKENYTIIFERNAAGIAYFKETHDITKKIIEEMK
ncbi:MAG TPA: OmpH family outer membrane protein [Syntrophorhabdaceae bacterium]|nr:OmpH family outer membrane protein [Syntrophorhabdaceae bacterium]